MVQSDMLMVGIHKSYFGVWVQDTAILLSIQLPDNASGEGADEDEDSSTWASATQK